MQIRHLERELGVDLVERTTRRVALRLLRGPGPAVTPVPEERLVAVLPAEHPLAEHDVVPIDLLVGEPMVLVPNRLMPGFFEGVLQVFRRTGARPRVVQQAVHQVGRHPRGLTGLSGTEDRASKMSGTRAVRGRDQARVGPHDNEPPMTLARGP